MNTGSASQVGVEVWRGGVHPWELDDMAHMNVRFYVARAMEGLVGAAAVLGMPQAYSVDANATLLLRELHIRFLREARARAALEMRAHVVEIGDTDARLLLTMFHSLSGEPAASFQALVSHVTPRDARPFPWPREVLENASGLAGPISDYAAARSVDLAPFESQASLARAEALGLMTISAGAIASVDCDVFGRMRAEQFIARISDGIPRLVTHTRGIVAGELTERIGGAVLEYRLVHLAWPRAGDRIVMRSGLAGADHRTQRLIHWMLDPRTGRPWGSAEAVVVTFDLDKRKVVPVSPEAQAALMKHAVPGLTL